MGRRLSIVPHTHWDREWYEPFETFRLRLVDMFDTLLTLLENDPSYAHFLLDGQLAMVDDYLQVRPEAATRLRALAAAGRIDVGPWYVLMDEFLVSPETIVRNLQLGTARAAAFGGAMDVGYLPDMFGHVAQMPQILAQAGMEHAVVWRGVPAAVERTGFRWEAPDGSAVRAEYLPAGYGNGASLPDDAKDLARRLTDHVAELEPYLVGDVLIMNGTDHQMPQPWLGRVVAEVDAMDDDLHLAVTSLPDHLRRAPVDGLPRWRGELRSGARANLLMGVTSTRVDVKQAAVAATRALERRAEPYDALFADPARSHGSLLDRAWLQVVRNGAHDSICACSVDDVVDAVHVRFAEARAIADGVAARALGDLAASMATPGTVVVNPSAHARSGQVELVVTGTEPPPGTQLIDEPPGAFGIPRGLGPLLLDAGTVRTILGLLPDGNRVDDHTWISGVTVTEDDAGLSVAVALGPDERPGFDARGVRQDLAARLAARPGATVRIELDQPPLQRVLARVGPVDGFGWAPATPAAVDHPVTLLRPAGDQGPVVLANGLVEVEVDPVTGTFAVDGHAGYGQVVDGGDLGDSYNWSPPGSDSVVDSPDTVSVAVGDQGPLRATATVTATYTWPDHVDGAARARVGRRSVTVTTVVELRADEPVVRVRTRFVNPCRDHRVRIHLPLPEPATTSLAECAFAVVERGLKAEGRPDELGLPTFPSRRFVQAGGLTVVHDGLHEYELVDVEGGERGAPAARTLALTVLRSTGMLSRLGMTTRPLPAGPLTPVEGLQLLGRPIEARYALCVAGVDPYAMADDVLLPLETAASLGGGQRPPSGRALSIDGARVSAVRRVAAGLEVRVFNPRPEPAEVGTGERSGWVVDLRGRPLHPVDGRFTLRPFGIATLWLQP